MKSLSCITRIAGFFLAGGCIAASDGASAGYLLTELTLGGKYSFAYDLNNSGEVVGEAYSPNAMGQLLLAADQHSPMLPPISPGCQ